MNKKLWSADSNTWLGLTLLYSAGGFGLGVWMGTRSSWILTFLILTLFIATIYSFARFIQARLLEATVNKKINDLGYTHVLLNAEPVVKNFQFVGFRSQGVPYPVSISAGGYTFEEIQCDKSYVTLYEYRFSDPENNMMVVFNQSEPPKDGGVMVFVK